MPAVVVLVLSYVFWSMAAVDERTRFKQTLVDIAAIENASRLFRADHRRCPVGVEELTFQSDGGGYIAPKLDPWGQPYQMRCPAPLDEGGVFVLSGGPDGSFEGEDNITSL